MKETGVIFSTPMARAAHDGLKTVTRRMRGLEHLNENPDQWAVCRPLQLFENVKGGGVQEFPGKTGASWIALKDSLGITDMGYYVFSCPFGEVGDRIWMRETWNRFGEIIYYKADEPKPFGYSTAWKPSIHMPRNICRFVGELVEIRLERLQDITEEDAIKEGIFLPSKAGEVRIHYKYEKEEWTSIDWNSSGKEAFIFLFKCLHDSDLVDKNPWVWVLKFKKL